MSLGVHHVSAHMGVFFYLPPRSGRKIRKTRVGKILVGLFFHSEDGIVSCFQHGSFVIKTPSRRLWCQIHAIRQNLFAGSLHKPAGGSKSYIGVRSRARSARVARANFEQTETSHQDSAHLTPLTHQPWTHTNPKSCEITK